MRVVFTRYCKTLARLGFFLCCLCTSAYAATVEGTVFSGHGPVPEAVVYAYPDYSSLVAKKNALVSKPGEKAGQYIFDLPAGTYYFVASGRQDGRELFAYHGVNPISVSEGYRWLPFFMVETIPAFYRTGPQGIGGIVTFKGEPLRKGVVSVYLRQEEQFRGMGLFTNSIGADGRFWFDLEPGSYVIIARQRQGDTNLGPLEKGDLFCYSAANPVEVMANQTWEVELGCYPRDNLTGFLDEDGRNPQGRRKETRRTASLEKLQIPLPEPRSRNIPSEQSATIAGRVTDMSGKPLEGLFVSAYPAQGYALFQMHIVRMQTKYITQTDAQGQYILPLGNAGTYYVLAREKLGEAPDHLEYYGLYSRTPNHGVTLAADEIKTDVDIWVDRVMP